MKRILLLGIAFAAFAGTTKAQLSWGTKIGQTYYDLHSNSAGANRFVVNEDGSMSAVWTEHWRPLQDGGPISTVRGFGYNHYKADGTGWQFGQDGECWEENYGCASQYVGWPEILNLPDGTAKKEYVITHTPLKITQRDEIGTGDWEKTKLMNIDIAESSLGITWPRAVTSGNYIHLIGTLNEYTDPTGVQFPVRYYRSADGGASWTIKDYMFDTEETVQQTDYIYTYNYDTTITAYGDTVFVMDDTIMSGPFMVGSAMFDADSVFADTMIGTSVDTIVYVWSVNLSGDTAAILETYKLQDDTVITLLSIDTTTITYDVTVNLIEYVGGDGYAIHANGSNVAVTFGDGKVNAWLMFKSTDNGTSWTRHIISRNSELPSLGAGQGGEVVMANAGTFEVVVDNSGKVHVFDATAFVDEEFGYTFTPQEYMDEGAGIWYWTEGMSAPKIIATPHYGEDGDDTDYSAVGSHSYAFGAYYAVWPSAAFDEDNNIYMIYSGIAEGTEYITKNTGDSVGFNDLYLVYSTDGGASWINCDGTAALGMPTNIAKLAEAEYPDAVLTLIEDDIYPCAYPFIKSDGLLHFTWQGDFEPGIRLRTDEASDDQLQFITYAAIDVKNCAITPGFAEKVNKSIKVSLAPNPANTVVTVSADYGMKNISIVNAFGQEVRVVNAQNNMTMSMNVADLANGIYVIKVETEKGFTTQKLSVNR